MPVKTFETNFLRNNFVCSAWKSSVFFFFKDDEDIDLIFIYGESY